MPKVKGIAYEALHAELMKDPEFRAAYAAEVRRDKMQEILTTWRNHAGLTSGQVAERMGVNPSTVSRMEKNVTKASVETILRYADACGVEHPTLTF